MIKRKGLKSVALAIAAFSLIAGACGSDSDTVTEETTAEATEESTAALPGEGLLACQVTDTGGVDDKGFNQIAYKGLQDAEAQLGVSIDVLESTTDADYGPNLQNFADKGCNIIVTVGFLLGDATREAAEANPNIDYAIVDSAFDPPIANARGLLFATDQSSFLAGFIAAAMTKTGIVSTFGGVKIPPVTRFMDGFVKGVNYHNEQKGTSVKVLGWNLDTQEGTFTGNFESLDDGKNVAKSQADEGADIIYPVAGPVGIGSAKFAKESGGKVKIIGVDVDMSVSNPDDAEVYIGSALENIDAAVFAAITDTVNGVKSNENYLGTLANGGVGFAYTAVPAELQAEVEAIAKSIADGTIKL
jgi:basic membrane protein A